jgi:hypothetical protein
MIVSFTAKTIQYWEKFFLSIEIHHKRKIGVGDEESLQ